MASNTSKGTTAERARAAGAKVPERARKQPPKRKVRNVRVLGEDVVLEWGDNTYTIERDAIDDVEFVLELEQGKNLSAVVRLLGPGQWETFKAAHRVGVRVPYSEAEEFLVALLEELQKVTASGN